MVASMDDLSARIFPPAHRIHPGPLPTWRWLPQFFINPLSVYSEQAFDILYGRAKAFGIDSLSVNDPAAIHHVLQANMANYRRPIIQPRLFRPAMGSGLFLAEAEDWRQQRRMLAPLFSPAATNDLIPHFQTASVRMLQRLDGIDRTQMSEVFHRSTLDAVLMALFSLPGDGDRAELAAMTRDYLNGAGRPNPLDAMAKDEDDLAWAQGARRRFRKRWAGMVDGVIAARRAQGTSAAHRRGDLLDLLLSARDPDTGEGLTDAEIRDQCSTMLAAGFETTSRLLFWASYLLGLDQAEQGRIRAEVQAFRPDQVTTMEDLSHWPRLRQTLLEALRLYPPAAYIVRKAIADDVIGEEKITAGTEVWISPYILHRHRKFWERPTEFWPDRFKGQVSPWTRLPAYLPFGAGPRICIGASFAMAEAQIILASLLANYRLVPEENRPVLPVFRVTTVPDRDPWMRLERV